MNLDLATLFPSKKFDGGPLTAIILSHRTTEGLEQWSEMAVTEREVLAESVSLYCCSSISANPISVYSVGDRHMRFIERTRILG